MGYFPEFTQVACQLLKYFVPLRKAPPSQSRILCQHRVHGDVLLEPEASRGDFLTLAALAQVPLFGAESCAVSPSPCPPERVQAVPSGAVQCPCVPGSSPGPAVTAAAAV